MDDDELASYTGSDIRDKVLLLYLNKNPFNDINGQVSQLVRDALMMGIQIILVQIISI